jgi:cation transport ATPase
VRTPPGFVILRDSRAHPVAVAITRSVQAYTTSATPKLDFYVVDGRHVLGRVRQEDELYGDELFRPNERSKLAKRKAEAQVAAAGTQL